MTLLAGGSSAGLASSSGNAPAGTPPHLTDWPTYLGNSARQADAFGENSIDVANAHSLHPIWNFTTGGEVVGSPAISGDTVFVGSWDGYEYALNASTGHLLWKDYLGRSFAHKLGLGVSSSPTISHGVVYVGGGGPGWFALSASNGSEFWNVTTANVSAGYYNWASPLLAKGFAFVGMSSKFDNPLIRGGVQQISLKHHSISRTFYTTAKGTVGASVWTSPSYDASTNSVLVTTGNSGPNGSAWGESLLRFNASTLKLTGHWTVPPAQLPADSDFGATPLVFSPPSGGTYVAASNKNDHFYVWNASTIGAGPIWNRTIANAPTTTGPPNLGPAAWGGGLLFVGTSNATIHGRVHNGSVRAFFPLNGTMVWQKPEAGAVLGAPVYADGTLIVPTGHDVLVLNASSGARLFRFTSNGTFVGAPAVGHGEIVFGSTKGVVYALAPKAPPSPPPHRPFPGSPAQSAAQTTSRRIHLGAAEPGRRFRVTGELREANRLRGSKRSRDRRCPWSHRGRIRTGPALSATPPTPK